MDTLIDEWLLASNLEVCKGKSWHKSLTFSINLMFAYATLRPVTTVGNFVSVLDDETYDAGTTLQASIGHLNTVRRDWSALNETNFLDYFHYMQENSAYYAFEIEQTIVQAKLLIKNNDVQGMSVVFKNTDEFRQIMSEEYNHLPLNVIPLKDGWIHPLSEFDSLTYEPINNWGKASFVLGILTNRMPVFKLETVEMRENQRKYLLQYFLSLRLRTLSTTPAHVIDHMFTNVVRYLDSLYLEILHELAQTLGKN